MFGFTIAGSEGESAFTPDFISKVDAATLMARRLEAGVINTGLSQLQVVFSELKKKKQLSSVRGNGLRRILHAYINASCMISVVFTLSPALNNAVSTESTLKFAVQAGMVKVKPVKAKKKIDFPLLVTQLEAHISEQAKIIDGLRTEIDSYEETITTLSMQLDDEKTKYDDLLEKISNSLENGESIIVNSDGTVNINKKHKNDRKMEYMAMSQEDERQGMGALNDENESVAKYEFNPKAKHSKGKEARLSIAENVAGMTIDSDISKDRRNKSRTLQMEYAKHEESKSKQLELETEYLRMGNEMKKLELKMEFAKCDNEARKLELETEYLKLQNEKVGASHSFEMEYVENSNEMKRPELESQRMKLSAKPENKLKELQTEYLKMGQEQNDDANKKELELQLEYMKMGRENTGKELDLELVFADNDKDEISNAGGQSLPQLASQYMKMSEKQKEIELRMEYLRMGKDPKKLDLEMQYLRTSNKQQELHKQVQKFQAENQSNDDALDANSAGADGLQVVSENNEVDVVSKRPGLHGDLSNSIVAKHTRKLSESLSKTSAKEIAANIKSFLNELREEAENGYDTSEYEIDSEDASISDEEEDHKINDRKGSGKNLEIPKNANKNNKERKESDFVANELSEAAIDEQIRRLNAARAQNAMDQQLVMDVKFLNIFVFFWLCVWFAYLHVSCPEFVSYDLLFCFKSVSV